MATRLLPYFLLAAITAGYLAWSWSTILGGFGGDNANYLLMAQYYSPYSTPSPAASYLASASIYPPLFPLLLGLSGGGESLLLAHLVTTGFLLLAFVIFYLWLIRAPIDTKTAWCTLIALALLPGIYFQTLSIHSENLYVLLTMAALFCLSESQRRPSQPLVILALLSIAAAYLTRTAAISLIFAALAWMWFHRIPRKGLLSLLLIAPVILWSQLGKTGTTNYWQQLLNGYHDPAVMADQISLQARYLFVGWLTNFGDSRASSIAGIATLAAGLAGTLWRIKLGYADGLYVLCYIAMAILWPFPAEAQRLTIAILPIILMHAVWLADKWKLPELRIKPLVALLLATITISVIPEFALHLHRFLSPLPTGIPTTYRHAEWWYSTNPDAARFNIQAMAALEQGMKHIESKVPGNACIYSIKPSVVAYLSKRKSIAPPSAGADADAFESSVLKSECRFFYMMIYTSPSFSSPLYPYERMREKLEIIEPTYLYPNSNDSTIVGLLARMK
ncbi:MAG TPA: hypothetical protein VK959_04715 [Methylophilaceae bacterium]|jgi:hypothetical protein|nr:hypothetical protein [Methylophilaceae bacterium]